MKEVNMEMLGIVFNWMKWDLYVSSCGGCDCSFCWNWVITKFFSCLTNWLSCYWSRMSILRHVSRTNEVSVWPIFPEDCMKLKKFGSRTGVGRVRQCGIRTIWHLWKKAQVLELPVGCNVMLRQRITSPLNSKNILQAFYFYPEKAINFWRM